MRSVRFFALLLVSLSFVVTNASADLIPLGATSLGSGNGFAYTFKLTQNSNEHFAPGEFFLIFDFGQATGVDLSNLQGTWSYVQNLTDSDAPPPSGVDAADILNIRFTYAGANNLTGSDLGTVEIDVQDKPIEPIRSTRSRRLPLSNLSVNLDAVQTPEPSALLLLGSGLVGFGVTLRRKLRS